jgi:ABC-2 type transport system permease protein
MKHELMLLLKQRSILLLLFISMLLTWLSLHNGWQNIHHIREQIGHAQLEADLRQQSQLADYASRAHIDAGEIGYYTFHNVYQHPPEWSFIALGNRLVAPYVQRIRLLGLQGQLYDGESHHPEYVMLGSFDYAFWLVFFTPLLCIALMHDLKASEFQAQRLLFLNSLVTNPTAFWVRRVMLRWLLILLSLVTPLTIFAIIQSLSIQPLINVIAITTLYTLFWVVICVIVSLRKQAMSASFNAMLLASIWLLLCVVLPNLAQLWLHQRYPIQDGSQIVMQHRQLVHNAWDQPKADTLDPFYVLYPQWQNTPAVTGRFHWKWYFAFQHMADVNLEALVSLRAHTLQLRDQTTAQVGIFLPSIWVQNSLENIAQSNVTHLIMHRRRITDFHTQLRHFLYPYLFEEKAMTVNDLVNMPTFENQASATVHP